MRVNADNTCSFCKVLHSVEVDENGYKKWKFGRVLIQNALPDSSLEDREILMTGLCDKAWNNIFPPEA